MSRLEIGHDQRLTPQSGWVVAGLMLMALLTGVPTILLVGFEPAPISEQALRFISAGLLGAYGALFLLIKLREDSGLPRWRRLFTADALIVGVGLTLVWWLPGPMLASALIVLGRASALVFWALNRGTNPAMVLVTSFATFILLGTGALMLPAATPADAPIGPVDAIFTATSAVCVTGLIVRDTATEFTRLGQGVILILLQLGGLGIMLFGGLLALVLGSSLGVRARQAISSTTFEGLMGPGAVRRVVMMAGMFIFGFELLGATILYLGWPATWPGAPADIQDPLWRGFHAMFFSASAFCNAGFATTPNSLMGLRDHWTSLGVVASLIVIGGIGLPVLVNLYQIMADRLRPGTHRTGPPARLTLHSKLVLSATAVLYLVGVAVIVLSERTQHDLGFWQALADAHFMSISARTAGFNVVDVDRMGALSRFGLVLLMFIGGSPGSTAGGVKTIAIATLVLIVWTTVRGRSETNAFGRRIPDDLTRKAAALVALGVGVIVLVIAGLSVTEMPHDPETAPLFERVVFEAVSACSTVGLSMGLTPDLSEPGRIIVSVGMFLGRIGPLAFLIAMASIGARKEPPYAYATESVMMS